MSHGPRQRRILKGWVRAMLWADNGGRCKTLNPTSTTLNVICLTYGLTVMVTTLNVICLTSGQRAVGEPLLQQEFLGGRRG
jgi:hypothetical protein